jgi:adenosylcobinamide-GDP ribazoletransferase
MLRRQVKLLICAVQFLTRLPTPQLQDFQPDWITRSARYFPLAGQLVGLIAAATWLIGGWAWPGLPAAVLAVGAGVLATGGFHEDGLADTADGLGGGQSKAQRLEIMKDSRIGSYGALALGLLLMLRVGLLAGLPPWRGALALVVAHGGARAAAVVVMAASPYVGDPEEAKIKPAPQGVRWTEAATALALAAWPLAFLAVPQAALGLALAAVSSVALALLARRLIGGVTGDVLGAVEQLAEAAFLMGAAAAFPVS